jgi:CheY-like chemotaxis protein
VIEEKPADGLAILLGEDDPVNAMLVKAILRKAGHRVELATDFAALTKAAVSAGGKPDLVICDMHMPGGTLVEFLKTVRASEAAAQVPIMVLTGEASAELLESLGRCGADNILQKPVDPMHLTEEVRRLHHAGTKHRLAR